jgi:hypothetical protein
MPLDIKSDSVARSHGRCPRRDTFALEILRGLDSTGKLTADQQLWIPTIEQLLAKLPTEHAEAKQ